MAASRKLPYNQAPMASLVSPVRLGKRVNLAVMEGMADRDLKVIREQLVFLGPPGRQ